MRTTDLAGALAAERRKPRNCGHPLERHVPAAVQRFPPQATRVDELGLNTNRSAGRLRSIAEPAPATKHLTIDLDHPGAST
jgi:hypothetical protein